MAILCRDNFLSMVWKDENNQAYKETSKGNTYQKQYNLVFLSYRTMMNSTRRSYISLTLPEARKKY